MEKMVIFHNILDENARPALERWFRRYHVPEVLVQYPWTNRYLLYRPVPPPQGAEDAGLYTYRIHENWAPGIRHRRGKKGMLAMTPEPIANAIKADVVHIPAEPTEDFLGSDWHFDEHPILRWLIAYRYPAGADISACDRFFLEQQAPEIMQMPGLVRFFSHRAVEFEGSALPITTGENDSAGKAEGFKRHWNRLSELWFENSEGWYNAVRRNPPVFTRPSWASSETFPFLKPGDDFIHTFVLESPDCDFTRTFSQLYY